MSEGSRLLDVFVSVRPDPEMLEAVKAAHEALLSDLQKRLAALEGGSAAHNEGQWELQKHRGFIRSCCAGIVRWDESVRKKAEAALRRICPCCDL